MKWLVDGLSVVVIVVGVMFVAFISYQAGWKDGYRKCNEDVVDLLGGLKMKSWEEIGK